MARVLALIIAVLLVLPGQADEGQERAKLEALKGEIQQLQQSLRQRSGELDRLKNELQSQELALAAINGRISALDHQAAGLEADLSDLGRQQRELHTSRQQQQELIARELDSAYRLGQAEPIKLLLNQEDPQKFARTMRYYRYFVDARRQKIQLYQKTLEDLARVESDIATKRNQLDDSRELLMVEKDKLGRAQEERRTVLTHLNAELDTDQARLQNLEKDRRELEKIIAHLKQAIQNLAPQKSQSLAELKGKLPWPVEGKVIKAFGSERAATIRWTGWLIGAAEGRSVVAIHAGRVVFADYLRGHGLMLIVDHGGGYLSLYAHNQVLLRELGAWVQGGDEIALAGNSGGLVESALYFEIRHNGKPQDPKPWLIGRR